MDTMNLSSSTLHQFMSQTRNTNLMVSTNDNLEVLTTGKSQILRTLTVSLAGCVLKMGEKIPH